MATTSVSSADEDINPSRLAWNVGNIIQMGIADEEVMFEI